MCKLTKEVTAMDRNLRFSELFEPIEGDLYRMAFLYLKNRDDALDCVQEAALRCYKGMPRLRKPEFFKTWAIRITINCAKDILKKRGSEISIDDLPEVSQPSKSLENEVLDRLTLTELLEELTPTERAATVLRHAFGYGFGDISKMLGIPYGTAKSACYRAIEKIRRRYSE